MVREADQVGAAMARIKADIVLTPVSDASMMDVRARATAATPAVLPVLATGMKAEVSACKQTSKTCNLKLKDDLKITDAVNEAMKKRAQARSVKK
jgi:hypothetical protein